MSGGEDDAPPPATPRAEDVSRWVRAFGLARRAASAASVASVLALAVVAGRTGHTWLVTTPRFGARDIVVDGATHTTRDEVLRAARITPARNVLSIDTDAAARAVAELPWVAHASVTRRLPGTVRVVVEERAPAALVAAGGLYLAAADGTLFKRALPGDPGGLPVVTGISREDFERDPEAAREWVRDALALLADVGSTALREGQRVEEVHREPTGDLAITVGDTYVWLGRGPYRAKLARLRVVLAELGRRTIDAAEVHLESDRHPERVTVRTRGTVDLRP